LARVVRVRFWMGIGAGWAVSRAARVAGVSYQTGYRWFVEAGGVIGNALGVLGGRYLSVVEGEEISVGLARGDSVRRLRGGWGGSASTVSREIIRNGGAGRYRAYRAEVAARERARRPKTAKLADAAHAELRMPSCACRVAGLCAGAVAAVVVAGTDLDQAGGRVS
jgi:IS30 family transposase